MKNSKIETLEIAENGNTNLSKGVKQGVQLKNWCFTWNNYSGLTDLGILETTFEYYCKRFVFQEEMGENGTKHVQGVIECKKKMRFSEFKLPKQIHWEKTRNIEASLSYCCKEETRCGKTVSFGIPKPIVIIEENEFYDWQKDVIKIIRNKPDNRKIIWIFESIGNTGKSSFVKHCAVKKLCWFCNGGKCNDLINLVYNKNMDICNCVIWDLPRSNRGRVSYDAIECIKNGLITNLKYETGDKIFNTPNIIIFSNYLPYDISGLSEDRWSIFEIVDKQLVEYRDSSA